MWLNKLLLISILWKSSDALLIRSPNVYQNIIAGMNERYKFGSLTLLHGFTQYNPYENIELATKLMRLQVHFARLWVPTAIMSIELFKKQEIPRLNLYQKPFFVFLNDYDELRNQLTPDFFKAVTKFEPVSLIFFRDKTKSEEFFENMFIPLNCQFMVAQRNESDEKNEIITEVYRFIEHGELQDDFLTSWSPVTGMQLPKKFLHHRRKNFRGYNVNVGWFDTVYYRNPLIATIVNNVTANILSTMKQELNLNITYHKSSKLGNCYDNGTCTDAVAKIVSKELDILSRPTATYHSWISEDYVDLSMTSYETTEHLYFRKRLYWWIYVNSFHYNIWIFLGIHILLTSMAIIYIEYKKKAMLLGPKVEKLIPLNVSDICFRVWSMFNVQMVPYSKYTQVQLLQFTSYLLFIITYTVYSAKFVSFLATSSENIPFSSFKDAEMKKGFVVDLIKDSESSSRYMEISHSELIINEKLSRSLFEGFDRLCENENFIFIDFPEYVDYYKNMINISCEIRKMKSFRYFFSYVLQKNSVLKRYLDEIIIRFRERGIYRYTSIYEDENPILSTTTSGIDIEHVCPLFVFLLVGQLLSILILLFELVIHKLNLKQYKTIKSKRIRKIIAWSSKGIYGLRHRVLKAKHRRSKRKLHRYC